VARAVPTLPNLDALPARLRLALAIIAGTLALAVGYALARSSPLFSIDRVTVIGATGSARDAIRAEAANAAGSGSLLAVDPQAVADAVAGMPLVRSVRVDRAFPHELRVTVVAEHPAAIIQTGTSRYLIARSGRVMGDAGKGSRLPLLTASAAAVPAPGDALPPSTLDQVHLAAALLDHRDVRVTQIADNGAGLVARLAGGTQLRLGDGTDLDRKLVVTATLLAKRPLGTDGEPLSLKYLDVSVPDHPVLRTQQLDPSTTSDADGSDAATFTAVDQPVDVALVIADLFRPAEASTGD
jgi:cell division protein FtsQ